jgi:ATP-dependent exoDNAse (exonuclease V) beta subunit
VRAERGRTGGEEEIAAVALGRPTDAANEALTLTPTLSDQAARDAIRHALDETLVVEAAAGTGKTTALVQRIVEVVARGGATVQQIVAVTFTEKAAGELKLRLREAFERAREEHGTDPGVRRRLDDSLARLEEAHVNTIHGFCADLLRERPVEAGVDPLFEVLTEARADRLRDEAFHGWLSERLEDPPEGIRRALRRTPFGDEADGPTERLRRAARELGEWRDFKARWRHEAWDRDREAEALIAQVHGFADLAAKPSSANDPLHVDARPALHRSDEIRKARELGVVDFDGWEAALIDLSRNRDFRRARKGSGKSYGPGVLRESVVQARDELLRALEAFREAADASLAACLQRELAGCLDRYERLKAKAGALDFLDLLLRARNLVRDGADVRHAFQQRFTRMFVDEFQDTDPLQAELLLLLAADDPSVTDWRQVTPVPGKLFLVGDPKQSIYRFRRADVGLYRDVCDLLASRGARPVELRTSFRATPEIQTVINAAFSRLMTGDRRTLQADYVPLDRFRPSYAGQPSVVTLPVPEPYGRLKVGVTAIEASLPDAVGAFIHWLVNESRWTVTEGDRRVQIAPRHICLLFRRFVSWGKDITRPYVEAIEARSVPHLLVGGKTFHDREEVESIRVALAAIEWPDDELSVFGTLRGTLFAIGDEELLEYRHTYRTFHPYRVPREVPAQLARTARALALLRGLHGARNHRPVADTIQALIDATRAHVGFVLRGAGEQVLANVLYIAELARQYEASGGISYRGFVDELREAARREQAPEAPILEEGSDGVRLMTVHKAKGLEFPVVILADITARLRPFAATRHVDPDRGLCAMRLGGWSPRELLEHGAEELAREEVEGVRIAYVAATRARDLLVVPAVGDGPFESGWIGPLNEVIYPPVAARRDGVSAPGCPAFKKDSVLNRPNGDPARPDTVAPGLHQVSPECSVVWWDPRALDLRAERRRGLRRDDLIKKDVPEEVVQEGLRSYLQWKAWRREAIERGSRPSVLVRTATDHAAAQVALSRLGLAHDLSSLVASGPSDEIRMVLIARDAARPAGPRYGSLVHAVLAVVPLEAGVRQITEVAALEARIFGATQIERASAAAVVERVLAHELMDRARRAAREGHCRREVPLAFREADGTLVEGVVDLAFEEDEGWTVVDFKTDHELGESEALYWFQVKLYAQAIAAATSRPATPVLVNL